MSIAVVKLLLAHGASVSDKQNKNALNGAVSLCYIEPEHVEIAHMLLEHKVPIDKTEALHHAARHGSRDLVQLLLKYDVSIDALNYFRMTPLQEAVQNKKPEGVKLLLEAGANPLHREGLIPSALDSARTTPEMLALFIQHDLKEISRQKSNFLHLLMPELKNLLSLFIAYQASYGI